MKLLNTVDCNAGIMYHFPTRINIWNMGHTYITVIIKLYHTNFARKSCYCDYHVISNLYCDTNRENMNNEDNFNSVSFKTA